MAKVETETKRKLSRGEERERENAQASLDKIGTSAAGLTSAQAVLDRYIDTLREENDSLTEQLAKQDVKEFGKAREDFLDERQRALLAAALLGGGHAPEGG